MSKLIDADELIIVPLTEDGGVNINELKKISYEITNERKEIIMNLDQAILFCRDCAENQRRHDCFKSAFDYTQMEMWLRELKERREKDVAGKTCRTYPSDKR